MIEKIANCTDFVNHSQYVFYEWGYIQYKQAIVGCYDIRTSLPPQLIPMEYQGWLMFVYLIFGTAALCYGLYIVARDPMDNNPKTYPDCYYYMTEDEIEETFM